MESTIKKIQQQLSEYFISENTCRSKSSKNQSMLLQNTIDNLKGKHKQCSVVSSFQLKKDFKDNGFNDKENRFNENIIGKKQYMNQQTCKGSEDLYSLMLEKNQKLLKRIQNIQQNCAKKSSTQTSIDAFTKHFSVLLKQYQNIIERIKQDASQQKSILQDKYDKILEENIQLKISNQKLLMEKNNQDKKIIDYKKNQQQQNISRQKHFSQFSTRVKEDDECSIVYQFKDYLIPNKLNPHPNDKMIAKFSEYQKKIKLLSQQLKQDQIIIQRKNQQITYLQLLRHKHTDKKNERKYTEKSEKLPITRLSMTLASKKLKQRYQEQIEGQQYLLTYR